MKKLLRSPGIKLLLALLFIACTLFTALGTVGAIAVFSNYNSFFAPGEVIEKDFLDSIATNAAYGVYTRYMDFTSAINNDEDGYDSYYHAILKEYSADVCNYSFTIKDKDGNILFENYKADEVRNTVENNYETQIPYSSVAFSLSFPDWASYYEYFNSSYESSVVEQGYTNTVYTDENGVHVDVEKVDYMNVTMYVSCSIRSDVQPVDELYYEVLLIEYVVYLKNLILPLTLLFFLTTVLFASLLCVGAGRVNSSDTVKIHLFDKLPYELFLLIIFGIVLLLFLLVANLSSSVIHVVLGGSAMAALCSLLLLWFIMSTARRAKNGSMWKNTVIFFLYKLIVRVFKATGKGVKYLTDNINLYWKTALIFASVIIAEVIYISICSGIYYESDDYWLLLLFAEKIIVLPLVIIAVINIKKIREIGQKLVNGEIADEISTAHMIPEFKKHAENLSKINDGIKLAVSEQLKSERMQTELITNVSHDIKTPLTSIINYVDLLSREDMPSDKARGYLEVIDRQSKRLKKLAVDVVEASKASSGSIEVNAERTDVNVLLTQTAGEYADKLNEMGLELVNHTSQEPLFIYADSRLIWRVFDNLMNNICKYSQRGTRVYLAATARDGKAEISFKNVSKSALNISAEELMERFVRGDASRNTEGSGLGLAISRSLSELQGGNLELEIDGDLFKALVVFPQIQ